MRNIITLLIYASLPILIFCKAVSTDRVKMPRKYETYSYITKLRFPK